ncbi:hypothetical protein AAMO2058_000161000 [Amorphochlora amoebiformis]
MRTKHLVVREINSLLFNSFACFDIAFQWLLMDTLRITKDISHCRGAMIVLSFMFFVFNLLNYRLLISTAKTTRHSSEKNTSILPSILSMLINVGYPIIAIALFILFAVSRYDIRTFDGEITCTVSMPLATIASATMMIFISIITVWVFSMFIRPLFMARTVTLMLLRNMIGALMSLAGSIGFLAVLADMQLSGESFVVFIMELAFYHKFVSILGLNLTLPFMFYINQWAKIITGSPVTHDTIRRSTLNVKRSRYSIHKFGTVDLKRARPSTSSTVNGNAGHVESSEDVHELKPISRAGRKSSSTHGRRPSYRRTSQPRKTSGISPRENMTPPSRPSPVKTFGNSNIIPAGSNSQLVEEHREGLETVNTTRLHKVIENKSTIQ